MDSRKTTAIKKPKAKEKPAAKVKASPKGKPTAEQAQPQPTKRKRGRQPMNRAPIIEAVIERISVGEPLRQICRDPGMPSWNAIYNWMDDDKEFASRFARAREKGEEAIAEECLDIADNATNDWMEAHGQDDVAYKLNGEHVQRSKLRIETRLKLLAKWNPKKWGEKVDLNHGVQPDNPLASLLGQIQGTPLRPADKKDD